MDDIRIIEPAKGSEVRKALRFVSGSQEALSTGGELVEFRDTGNNDAALRVERKYVQNPTTGRWEQAKDWYCPTTSYSKERYEMATTKKNTTATKKTSTVNVIGKRGVAESLRAIGAAGVLADVQITRDCGISIIESFGATTTNATARVMLYRGRKARQEFTPLNQTETKKVLSLAKKFNAAAAKAKADAKAAKVATEKEAKAKAETKVTAKAKQTAKKLSARKPAKKLTANTAAAQKAMDKAAKAA